MSGESRQELLAWLNDLLQVNYTKIEQVGTGAALCQIMDSIYGDVQMSKVKFVANQEYEYVANFKVLQKTFLDHKIDKVIPVERLIKCKFQDNLEFLQWVKKYWDTYYPGGNYDANARRKGGPVDAVKNMPMKKTLSNSSVDRAPKAMKAAPSKVAAAPAKKSLGGTAPRIDNAMMVELQTQVTQLHVTIDSMEKERDFYFNKLRDVEVMVQAQLDDAGADPKLISFCKEIQRVLYSTEEGFEVPQEATGEVPSLVQEEEVF